MKSIEEYNEDNRIREEKENAFRASIKEWAGGRDFPDRDFFEILGARLIRCSGALTENEEDMYCSQSIVLWEHELNNQALGIEVLLTQYGWLPEIRPDVYDYSVCPLHQRLQREAQPDEMDLKCFLHPDFHTVHVDHETKNEDIKAAGFEARSNEMMGIKFIVCIDGYNNLSEEEKAKILYRGGPVYQLGTSKEEILKPHN